MNPTIELVHLRQDLEIAMGEAERRQAEIDKLNTDYRGCRPSWVSTDIGRACSWRDAAMREAAAIRRKIAAIEKGLLQSPPE